jgi:hypothetical protein
MTSSAEGREKRDDREKKSPRDEAKGTETFQEVE